MNFRLGPFQQTSTEFLCELRLWRTLCAEKSKRGGILKEDKVRNLTEKLELLLEQNKDIAHGLVLLDKYVRGKTEFESSNSRSLRSV